MKVCSNFDTHRFFFFIFMINVGVLMFIKVSEISLVDKNNNEHMKNILKISQFTPIRKLHWPTGKHLRFIIIIINI